MRKEALNQQLPDLNQQLLDLDNSSNISAEEKNLTQMIDSVLDDYQHYVDTLIP